MFKLIGISAFALIATCSSALAECEQFATGRNDRGIYRKDKPTPPTAVRPPTCRLLNDELICDGEIGQEIPPVAANVVMPRNCGWRGKGKTQGYVCW